VPSRATERRPPWNGPVKRPFGGPEQVLAYLGRYTHRVAIANSRLTAVDDTQVGFRWMDYRHHCKTKLMTLASDELSASSLSTRGWMASIGSEGAARQCPPDRQSRDLPLF
jgi:Putative transposase